MHTQYKLLLSSTIQWLTEEGFIIKKSSPSLPKIPFKVQKSPPKSPSIPKAEQENPSQDLVKKTKETPKLPFETIQKHLPHMQLIKEIPQPALVAIFVLDEKELPFFKNLAKAIQNRFCPVKILSSKHTGNLQDFALIISPKNIPTISEKKQLLIASPKVYESNSHEKKLLWSQICQRLSPKSL